MRLKATVGLLIAATSFAVYANPGGPLASLSMDSIVAMVMAIFMALIAGYARGSERRIVSLEHDCKQLQAQISLFRETTHDRHPNRQEFNQLREDMRQGFDEVKELLKERRHGHR